MNAGAAIKAAAIGCFLDFGTGLLAFAVATVSEVHLAPLGILLILRELVALVIAVLPLAVGIGLWKRRAPARVFGLILGGLDSFAGVYVAANYQRFWGTTHQRTGDVSFGIAVLRIPVLLAVGIVLLVVLTRPAVRAMFRSTSDTSPGRGRGATGG